MEASTCTFAPGFQWREPTEGDTNVIVMGQGNNLCSRILVRGTGAAEYLNESWTSAVVVVENAMIFGCFLLAAASGPMRLGLNGWRLELPKVF